MPMMAPAITSIGKCLLSTTLVTDIYKADSKVRKRERKGMKEDMKREIPSHNGRETMIRRVKDALLIKKRNK